MDGTVATTTPSSINLMPDRSRLRLAATHITGVAVLLILMTGCPTSSPDASSNANLPDENQPVGATSSEMPVETLPLHSNPDVVSVTPPTGTFVLPPVPDPITVPHGSRPPDVDASNVGGTDEPNTMASDHIAPNPSSPRIATSPGIKGIVSLPELGGPVEPESSLLQDAAVAPVPAATTPPSEPLLLGAPSGPLAVEHPLPELPAINAASGRNPLREGMISEDQPMVFPNRNPSRLGPETPPAIPMPATMNEPSLVRPPLTQQQTTDVASPSLSANPKHVHSQGDVDEEPFDPIKEYGPIFVGWPKPKWALVITGRQEGYIEPCGCAGLDRMRGGMSRRHTLFETLRKKGWPIVGIDAGSLAKGYGRQAELKFHTMVDGMKKMGYTAIGLGKTDLQLEIGELAADAASAGDLQSLFLSANAALFGFNAAMTAKSRVVVVAGRRIGITSVLGKKALAQINNADLEMIDAEKALAVEVPKLKQQADYLILLANATTEESLALAKKFPEFDLVVASDGAPELPPQPVIIEGTQTLLIEVGEKGMDAVVLAMFDDPVQPWRYQKVPLDSRFTASNAMKQLMGSYQSELERAGLAGLGIRPMPHPQTETNGRFVGSKKCEACHEDTYAIWKKSGHAKAYMTLTKADPPRNHDPECISCHVVGWHPTKHYPYTNGFVSVAKTPELVNVGCENCHGPGESHVTAEMGSDAALQSQFRQAVALSKEEAKKRFCYSCHDLDNSPDFNFDTYWPQIEHNEP